MLLVDLIIIGYFKHAWMNRKAPAPAAFKCDFLESSWQKPERIGLKSPVLHQRIIRGTNCQLDDKITI